MIGLVMTALVAGAIDIFDYNTPIADFFAEQGWLPSGATGGGLYSMGWYDNIYWPDWGIAARVSWVCTLGGVFGFGLIAWIVLSLVPLGRDRYWQAERWTLVFTLLGAVLVAVGLLGLNVDHGYGGYRDYSGLEVFLGGLYTTFVVGLFMLTWAWSCRTGLFLMLRRYENAVNDPDNPVCFACGYDLRGTNVSQCPECGAAIKHRQSSTPPESNETNTHAESRSTTR